MNEVFEGNRSKREMPRNLEFENEIDNLNGMPELQKAVAKKLTELKESISSLSPEDIQTFVDKIDEKNLRRAAEQLTYAKADVEVAKSLASNRKKDLEKLAKE